MSVEVTAEVRDDEPMEFLVRKSGGLFSPRISVELSVGTVTLNFSAAGAERLRSTLDDALADARRLIEDVEAKRNAAAATAASRA